MEAEGSKIDTILNGIDAGLETARPLNIPNTIRSIESDAWATIYESYEAGLIDTIEEAEAKFAEWRQVHILGRQGLKHVW